MDPEAPPSLSILPPEVLELLVKDPCLSADELHRLLATGSPVLFKALQARPMRLCLDLLDLTPAQASAALAALARVWRSEATPAPSRPGVTLTLLGDATATLERYGAPNPGVRHLRLEGAPSMLVMNHVARAFPHVALLRITEAGALETHRALTCPGDGDDDHCACACWDEFDAVAVRAMAPALPKLEHVEIQGDDPDTRWLALLPALRVLKLAGCYGDDEETFRPVWNGRSACREVHLTIDLHKVERVFFTSPCHRASLLHLTHDAGSFLSMSEAIKEAAAFSDHIVVDHHQRPAPAGRLVAPPRDAAARHRTTYAICHGRLSCSDIRELSYDSDAVPVHIDELAVDGGDLRPLPCRCSLDHITINRLLTDEEVGRTRRAITALRTANAPDDPLSVRVNVDGGWSLSDARLLVGAAVSTLPPATVRVQIYLECPSSIFRRIPLDLLFAMADALPSGAQEVQMQAYAYGEVTSPSDHELDAIMARLIGRAAGQRRRACLIVKHVSTNTTTTIGHAMPWAT